MKTFADLQRLENFSPIQNSLGGSIPVTQGMTKPGKRKTEDLAEGESNHVKESPKMTVGQ